MMCYKRDMADPPPVKTRFGMFDRLDVRPLPGIDPCTDVRRQVCGPVTRTRRVGGSRVNSDLARKCE